MSTPPSADTSTAPNRAPERSVMVTATVRWQRVPRADEPVGFGANGDALGGAVTQAGDATTTDTGATAERNGVDIHYTPERLPPGAN